jgi:hypothetical protein
MSEIIEILTSKGNGGQQFKVNTALPPAGQVITTTGSFETDNSEQKSIFSRGDNIAIISAGIILPESFILGNIGFGAAPLAALPRININFQNEPSYPADSHHSVPYKIQYFPIIAGSQGNFSIPLENFEYILNNFIDVSNNQFTAYDANYAPVLPLPIVPKTYTVTGIPSEFSCYLSIDPGTVKISMVNVPAILHNQIMRITPFIKIIHNFPLK